MPRRSLTAVFALTTFLFSSLVPWNLAFATEAAERAYSTAVSSAAVTAATATSSVDEVPAGRIAAALRKVERLLDRLETPLPDGSSPGLSEAERQAFRDAADTVDAEGVKVLAKLDQVAAKLSEESHPSRYGQRNQEKRERINQELAPLAQALDQLAEATDAERATLITQVRALIDQTVGAETHNPVDPDRLPHRPVRAKPEPPRTEAAQFQAAMSGVRVVEKATAPGPADLAETPEVRFTPDLEALADSLGDDPLAIYNWVRTNVLFVPTWGSIQGSEGCLLSLECNAHDTASLLVALLRSAGVPARYVVGTVELDADAFRSAMGDFANVTAAATLAASGGIPTVTVGDGSGNVAAVRVEHVWVEAFVDYVPSRGTGTSGETWVPLDAAIKPTQFTAPADLEALTGKDYETIQDTLAPTPAADGSVTGVPVDTAQLQVQEMVDAVAPALDAHMPDATVGEIFGGLTVEAPEVPLLPASLPGHVVTVGGRTAELPASARHTVELTAVDSFGSPTGLTLTLPTTDLVDQRLTLAWVPATDEDEALAVSYGGMYTTPPHLLEVRPQLLLEGVPAAVGSAVLMGTRVGLRVTFREPGRSDSVEHLVAAGTFGALGTDLQRISRRLAERREARLASARDQFLDVEQDSRVDDYMGEMLHVHGLSYFQQVELTNRLTAHQLGVRAVKRPAEGLITAGPSFSYLFGTAVETGDIGFNIDVRRYLVSAVSRTGDADAELGYMIASGAAGSAAEHTVFETLQGTRSVSAVKLLAEANRQGIPIYEITAANVDQVLPLLNLPSAVRSDVVNSVNAGKTVTVPQRAFQYLDWSGVGYLVLDPVTGAGGYLISGGLAGGGTAEDGEGSGFWSWVVAGTSWVVNQFGDKVVLTKVAAKLAAGFERLELLAKWLGRGIIGFSAGYTAYTTWNETGVWWKALGAGIVDLLASLAVGAIIGTAFIAGLTFGWTIFAIFAISIAATLLVNWINGKLFSWRPALDALRDRWAVHRSEEAPLIRGFDPLFTALTGLPVRA